MNEPWAYDVDLLMALGWSEGGDYVFDGERYMVRQGKISGTMGGGWYTIQPLSFQKRHNGHFGPPDSQGRRAFVKDPEGAYGPPPGIIFA